MPVPTPASGLPAPSMMLSLSCSDSVSEPLTPVATVIVRVLPESADAEVMDAPEVPVPERAKSLVPTPVTASVKVTSHCTDDALVGVGPTRTIELTTGGVLSVTVRVPAT